METVLEHLHFLYNRTQPGAVSSDSCHESDRFLEKFQKSTEAWSISIQMLATPSIPFEYLLFAAQTLRRKIVHDLSQLDFTELSSMKETLIHLLKSSKDTSRAYSIQIFLAVINFAMQVDPALWPDPIGDILNIYNDGYLVMKNLIIFLTLFPDECKHSSVSLEECQQENINLLQSMYVLKVLSFLFEVGNGQGWSKELLECTLNWIKYSIKSENDCMRCISALPLLELAFSGLTLQECAPICCEIINEVVFKTATIPSLSSTIPLKVFEGLQKNVQSIVQAVIDEDEDLILSWIDLCSEFCWSCEELLTERNDVFVFIMDTINSLVIPSNLLIVERTFSYWEGILEIFERVPQLLKEPQIVQRIEKFMLSLLKSLELPEEFNDPSARYDQREDYDNYKLAAHSLLSLYCSQVLTQEQTSSLISAYLSTNPNESIIITAIDATKAVSNSLSEQSPLVDICYNNLTTKHTINAYLQMLSHISYVGNVSRELQLVQKSLHDIDLFYNAILALKNIVHLNVATIPSATILDLIRLLAEKTQEMPHYFQFEIYGCISSLLSKVPIEAAVSVYQSLFKNTLKEEILHDPQDTIDSCQRIASVLKNAAPSHQQSITNLVMEHWYIFQRIASNFGDKVNVMEALTRVLKYLVLLNKTLLPIIIDFAIQQFVAHSLSWPVYLLRYFLREDTSHCCWDVLNMAIDKISAHIFGTSLNIEDICDVMIDFFKLLSLYTAISKTVDMRCFEMAVGCLVGNREWSTYSDIIGATVSYLTSCLKCIKGLQTSATQKHFEIVEAVREKAIQLFSTAALYTLIHGVLVDYPSSLIYPISELFCVLVALHRPIGNSMISVLKGTLQELPLFTARESEKQLEKFSLLIQRTSIDDLESFLYTLSTISQRRLV